MSAVASSFSFLMRMVAAVALYGIVWPLILIEWSVTEDSSLGGGPAGASAGFSAGLFSCACTVAIGMLINARARRSIRGFFTRIFFTRIMGSLLEANRFYDSVRLGILTVSTEQKAILFDGAAAKTLHCRLPVQRTVRRNHLQSSRRPLPGVPRHLPWFARRPHALPRTCLRGFQQERLR